MSNHTLGVYWAPGHQRQADLDYMQRLQPPAIRVLDPDPNQLVIAHKCAPKALLLPRDWALSEQHDDVRRDPTGTGKRHAHDWRGKIDRWRAEGHTLPPDNQIIVVGINEPRVWDMLPQVVEYTVAMLDECTQLGLRACALNLSVGWPANTGEGTPPDWTPYKPIEASIQRGDHFLTLHSYWYKSGPQDGAGWWAWRHRACPWNVPIIIGECGVDLYVDMQHWENDGKPNRGWRGNISPDQYAAQMEQYARGCDTRVVAILPFLTDYRSNIWESFDTLEAHPHFLARMDAMIPQAQPPTPSTPPGGNVFLPGVGTGAGTPVQPVVSYVDAPAGVNLRNAPEVVEGNVVAKLPYGEPVTILDVSEGSDKRAWAHVLHGKTRGFIRADLLSTTKPDAPQPPTPAPSEPVGDCWERAIAFVLKQEGGWADDPNDVGGATMKGITLGTYTRWRDAHGQPPPSKEDLRNITDAEVRQIYHDWYWLASGSNKLPFPLCLANFNIAVNAGPSRAAEFLYQSEGDFLKYMATAIEWYTKIDGWKHYSGAWTRRNAAVLREAAK
jgi:hypothetical protein